MTDHRRIQRSLFRMQLDPSFARRVFAREPEALGSCGLDPEDEGLLLAADPDAVSADFRAKLRDQVLGNVLSEFELSLASAGLSGPGLDLADGFTASPHFHTAVASDGPLVLAFARYAADLLDRGDHPPLLHAAHVLDGTMARARRQRVERPAPGPGEVVLAPRAWIVRVPAGTLAWAAALRTARETDASATVEPADPIDPSLGEELLLSARDRGPHRLAQVEPELLREPAAGLLRRCEEPLPAGSRAGYAREVGAAPDELERFVDGLVEDGVLVRAEPLH